MNRLALTLALVLVVAACGDDDTGDATATTVIATTQTSAAAETTTTTAAATTTSTTATITTTTAASAGGAAFEIASVSFGAPMVVITNTGDETGNLGGHWLCQRPAYQVLPDFELAPGESVAISLGGNVFLPPPGVLTIDDQLNLGGLSPSSGELGLYSSNAFGSPDAIVSYVEWGGTGHGRSDTAIEAGIWNDGGFVATTGETAVIQLTTLDSAGSSAWSGF